MSTNHALTTTGGMALTPILSVAQWLAERRPVAHFRDEPGLFAALSADGRDTVRRRMRAMQLIRAEAVVSQGVAAAVRQGATDGLSPKRLRSLYDAWVKSGDWVTLVVRSAERAEWREAGEPGLPDAFLDYVAAMAGKHRRADALEQAFRAVRRIWETGRNRQGEREAIPAYGFWPAWFARTYPGTPLPAQAPLPAGWSPSNLRRQLAARGKFSRAVKAALHESEAKARDFAPQVHGTRANLRFLEEVQFDDVRCDFRVFDPATGEVMDLWLLVARDRATSVMLGFGMRPARAREDGTQEHLRLTDMKQLLGWVLERWGLPPYPVTWKLENGTATLPEACARALGHLLDDRIRVSYARMLGGVSPAGYRERAKGNSRGKAMLESLNRAQHIATSDLPGQMGRSYEVRPADLAAREREAREIWQAARFLPAPLREQTEYPLATLAQARAALRASFLEFDGRTDHALEGFDEVLVWRRSPQHLWTLAAADPVPDPVPPGAEIRQRRESPRERMTRLVAPYRDQWTAVSPEAIAAFYEHTQRDVVVSDRGEIKTRIDGVDHWFRPAPGAVSALTAPGAKLLAYFHPDFPDFLQLSTRDGRWVGTWPRVALAQDEDTLVAALAATESAVSAVRTRAAELGAGERTGLEAMRSRNAELLRHADAIELAETPAGTGLAGGAIVGQLRTARETLAAARRAERAEQADAEDLRRLAEQAERNLD